MSLYSYVEGTIEEWVTGVDINYEQARGDELTAANMAASLAKGKQNYENGIITLEQYNSIRAHYNQELIDNKDLAGQVADEAGKGAAEGLKNLQTGVHDALAGTVNGILGTIPWQIYAVGGLVLFFYLGGGTYLKGILAKKD